LGFRYAGRHNPSYRGDVFLRVRDRGGYRISAAPGDVNRPTFKKIGLSGRAVIPLVLVFGCSTMATMVTRTYRTKRERIIATLLLALAIPCSAQMGVILALLGIVRRASSSGWVSSYLYF